jgi:hypothetical protein
MLQFQYDGDYSFSKKEQYLKLPAEYMINYLRDVSIKFSEGKGRGIFANKQIKSGELVMVDRAIASVRNDLDGNFEMHLSGSKILQDKTHNK